MAAPSFAFHLLLQPQTCNSIRSTQAVVLLSLFPFISPLLTPQAPCVIPFLPDCPGFSRSAALRELCCSGQLPCSARPLLLQHIHPLLGAGTRETSALTRPAPWCFPATAALHSAGLCRHTEVSVSAWMCQGRDLYCQNRKGPFKHVTTNAEIVTLLFPEPYFVENRAQCFLSPRLLFAAFADSFGPPGTTVISAELSAALQTGTRPRATQRFPR